MTLTYTAEEVDVKIRFLGNDSPVTDDPEAEAVIAVIHDEYSDAIEVGESGEAALRKMVEHGDEWEAQ